MRYSLGRQLQKRLLILAASLFVVALAGELLARIFFPRWAPRTGIVTQFWRYDPDVGWAHVPDRAGRFAAFGFDTQISINSEGFRGRPVKRQKDPGKTRILVLGDSYVWGYGIEEGEMFTTGMERLCPGVETVNLGVNAYGTDQ